MLRSRLFYISLMLLFGPMAQAKQSGIKFDGAVGCAAVTLSNPNGSVAGYDGLSLQGRLMLPLSEETPVKIYFQGVMRYHDLENTLSSDSESEVGNHIGPGVGLTFKFGKVALGYEYSMMQARHYYIGSTGRKTEFDYSATNIFAGIEIPFGELSIGMSYGYGTGKVSKLETGLSADSDYADQTIWLHIAYSTGADLGSFAKDLVKK